MTKRGAAFVTATVSAVAIFVAAGACSSGATPTDPTDAGIQDADSGTVCELRGESCTGAAQCCPPYRGYEVNDDAGCKARSPTALACKPPGPCGSLPGLVSCYQQGRDGGGVTVYFTQTLLPRLPASFEPCPSDLKTRVTAYPDCP